MSPRPQHGIPERRWLLLSEEGNHSWLGRATDPSEEEIGHAEAALARIGIGGWIAVSEGDYWGQGRMSLLQVRQLNGPKVTFEAAVNAFLAKRLELLERDSAET